MTVKATTRSIKVPKKYCDADGQKPCHFNSWTGENQENFCGLYGRHQENDSQYPKYKKPEFCTVAEVVIVEVSK